MKKDNTYHVNIYYSEEEVHDAFKNYYNDVKQFSKVHIFTKNAMALSLYGAENNVELYFSGGLWDKLKAWLAGEALFEQQLSQLNIPKENQERYRSLIKNGGTIIVSTQDESINPPIKDVNEVNDTAFVEDAVTPLPSTISNEVNPPQTNDTVLRTDSQIADTEITKTINENVLNQELDGTLFDTLLDDGASKDTKNQSFIQGAKELKASEVNDISELEAQLNKGTRPDLDLQNKFNEEEEHNTTDNTDEHDKTSEELTGHSNEPSLNDSIQIAAHEETFVVPTKHESVSRDPDDANDHTDDVMNLLNNNGTNQEDIVNSIQQLQALAQQAQQFYGFDNKQPQINDLLDLVLQLSPDEAMRIVNVISSNVPTDSTESGLDFDLLSKLGGYGTDEVKNLFADEQALEDEIIITPDEQNDLSVDYTHDADGYEAEQLLNEVSTEPTSEHNRHDSP